MLPVSESPGPQPVPVVRSIVQSNAPVRKRKSLFVSEDHRAGGAGSAVEHLRAMSLCLFMWSVFVIFMGTTTLTVLAPKRTCSVARCVRSHAFCVREVLPEQVLSDCEGGFYNLITLTACTDTGAHVRSRRPAV